MYGLNTQVVADSQCRIREVVSWPGSTHDARIWRSSSTKALMEQQEQFFVLGDSAYPISRTLVKPYKNPTGNQVPFNRALSGARTHLTENTIGILKRR